MSGRVFQGSGFYPQDLFSLVHFSLTEKLLLSSSGYVSLRDLADSISGHQTICICAWEIFPWWYNILYVGVIEKVIIYVRTNLPSFNFPLTGFLHIQRLHYRYLEGCDLLRKTLGLYHCYVHSDNGTEEAHVPVKRWRGFKRAETGVVQSCNWKQPMETSSPPSTPQEAIKSVLEIQIGKENFDLQCI